MPIRFSRPAIVTLLSASLLSLGMTRTMSAEEPASPATTAKEVKKDAESEKKWQSLFDGKTLKGWKKTDFPGKSDVTVENGTIVLHSGMDLTGINIDRKIPLVNYEVELEAMRVDGSDFFSAVTFPVGEKPCTLVVGGWGGGVVGLSSLNGFDASENETSTYREFENGTWYPIKLRVTGERITAWIDGKEMVDVGIRDKGLSIRIEVEWSRPFGIASWQTKSALRKIRIRELSAEEVKAVNAETPDD